MSDNFDLLMSAVLFQAVRDYCRPKVTLTERRQILRDLRSPRMLLLTDDRSELVAEQLEIFSDEITERLLKNHEIRRKY